MSLENKRVNFWRKRWLIKSIVNLWKKRSPERFTVCGDPNTKGTRIMDLPEDVIDDPNTKGTTIMDLPEDVIVDILLRLPVKSLCCIQCVSKTAFGIARSPGFATLHTLCLLDSATDSDTFKFPQLILLTKSSNQNYQSLVALQSLQYNRGMYTFTKTRQSALVSKICSAYNPFCELEFVYSNLLCFNRGYGVPRLLVNPLRGQVLQLPVSDIGVRNNSWCGMDFDHITSTYKIVHILTRDNGNSLMAQVLELGTSSWRNTHLVSPCDEGSIFLGTSTWKKTVYTRGYMHQLIYRNDGSSHIISFDFNKEELHDLPCPDLSKPYFDPLWIPKYLNLKLLNLRGSLAMVDFCLNRGDYMEIWVLNSYDKKNWELRHRIKIDELKLTPSHYAETCVEWEHGIFLAMHQVCYLLDFRYSSMTIVELAALSPSISSRSIKPIYTTYSILVYTESLISLKNYGQVIEATKSKEGEWHID